jgi:EAL domain-containing protein (putative c-di-GMP-specific phosphodiesterase class I)
LSPGGHKIAYRAQFRGIPLFSPSRLEREITEGVLINNTEDAVRSLKTLHERGYACRSMTSARIIPSLSYFMRFLIDSLKIERSFVREFHGDKNSAAITTAMIAVARALSLKVTAECGKSMVQLEVLREQRCDYAKGFFIASPKPVTEIEEWLANNRSTNIAVSG